MQLIHYPKFLPCFFRKCYTTQGSQKVKARFRFLFNGFRRAWMCFYQQQLQIVFHCNIQTCQPWKILQKRLQFLRCIVVSAFIIVGCIVQSLPGILVCSFDQMPSDWTNSWILMMPSINCSGLGGQPGIYTSTGMTLSIPCKTEWVSNTPPLLAQAPHGYYTTSGSAICS